MSPAADLSLTNGSSAAFVSLIVLILCIVVTAPLTIVRMLTRYICEGRKGFGWDDATAVIGQIGVFGHMALIMKMLSYGGGKDISSVSQSDVGQFNATYHTLEIVARFDFAVTKISILLLFFRCFFPRASVKTRSYWAMWGVIVFNVMYCLALTLSVALQCIGKNVPSGASCLNQDDILVIASIINVLSDAAVIVFPVLVVRKLQMNKGKKAKILVVFGFGFLAIAISIARLVWQVAHMDNKNITQYLLTVAILAVVEQSVGVMVCNMPLLPMFARFVRGARGSNSGDVNHTSRDVNRPFRSSPYGPLSTIAREFRQWRARPEPSLESGTYSLHNATTVESGHHGSFSTKSDTRVSTNEIGTGCSSATYGDEHDKSTRPVRAVIKEPDETDRKFDASIDSIDRVVYHAR